MSKGSSVVAVYATHTAAEAAVKALQHGGFDMKKLSIVGRDYQRDEHVIGYYNAGDRMKLWGKTGAFWGGLWGLLFGSAFFWIPGIGPLLVAGPLIGLIVAVLESAAGAVGGAVVVGGLSVVGAGLSSLGIPKNSVVRYEDSLKADKFLLIAHGSIDETTHAKEILDVTEHEFVEHHQ